MDVKLDKDVSLLDREVTFASLAVNNGRKIEFSGRTLSSCLSRDLQFSTKSVSEPSSRLI